ncbi:beta-ketoacyl synthase domain-containing protein [Colletotrichum sp. SAR 10_66]|nr:beta-ketoacyl synthase domain-containing protein [Colletotrichum sp. SAR 10_66]
MKLYLAIYHVWLSRMTGSDDMAIGIADTNRSTMDELLLCQPAPSEVRRLWRALNVRQGQAESGAIGVTGMTEVIAS